MTSPRFDILFPSGVAISVAVIQISESPRPGVLRAVPNLILSYTYVKMEMVLNEICVKSGIKTTEMMLGQIQEH